MALGAIIGGGLQIASGIFGNRAAKRAAAKRNKEARRLQGKLDRLEMNRQEIINPYENVQNLSGMLSNPFADLSVATQAAEMQAEQSDQALANTLDTIRETGGGAGSATALAQAALRSKQGISANIEQQEAQNQKLQAQGEQQAQAQRFSLLGQAVQADQAEFAIKEGRNEMDLDAAASLQDRALANQYAAEAGQLQALGNLASAGSSALTAGIGAAPW